MWKIPAVTLLDDIALAKIKNKFGIFVLRGGILSDFLGEGTEARRRMDGGTSTQGAVVYATAKILILKQITTDLCVCVDLLVLFMLLQRFYFKDSRDVCALKRFSNNLFCLTLFVLSNRLPEGRIYGFVPFCHLVLPMSLTPQQWNEDSLLSFDTLPRQRQKLAGTLTLIY
jgi:hypothetical protein